MTRFADTPAMGRPPLTEHQVREKVLAYCARYAVSPGPEGLPPFPSGKRESRQHREWLTVYRAHQRSRRRAASPPASSGADLCAVCALVLGPEDGVHLEPPGRRLRTRSAGRLHPECADLARLAETAGPDALVRLSAWLWPRRRGRSDGR